MSEVVLDASALLALLNAETGCDAVADALPDSVVSAVNLAEVVGKLAEKGMPEEAIREAIIPLALKVQAFDSDQAWGTGMLRPITRDRGLSLGDRACLTLGKRLDVPVLTADKAWKKLTAGVVVRMVR